VQDEGIVTVYSDVCLRCRLMGNIVVYSDVCLRYGVREILLCTVKILLGTV